MNNRQAKVKVKYLTCYLRRFYAHTHYHISRKIRKFGNMKSYWIKEAEQVQQKESSHISIIALDFAH